MSDANVNCAAPDAGRRSQDDPDSVFFQAALTPYRSLGRNGYLALMLVVGAICFGSGMLFVVMGAWPIFGFLGLDVALVWYAFRRSYRQARAFEQVSVSPLEVVLTKVSENGVRQEYRFNPAWVRLDITRVEDEGVTALALVSHGRSVPLGGFLNPPDRADFASVFDRALASARRGGPLPA